MLGVTLLAGCQIPGVSEAGRERCRQRGAGAGDPIRGALSYMRCLQTTDRSLAIEAAAARESAARQAALEACRNRRERVTALMASLRQAEQELAAARATSFRPSLPPPPWDPTRESRYRLEDQQLDRERYEADLRAWEQRVAPERANWRAERAQRIDVAQSRLDKDYQTLRSLQPDLFNGPDSIEFNPAVVKKVSADCASPG
jgi:hypothetical protein